MEWNVEITLKLLNLYRERPILWNSRLSDYKNRSKRSDAMEEISASLGVEKDAIEKKIRYLLSHFARELKREKNSLKSGSSTEEIYQSKWFAYNSMLFLRDKNKPTPSIDTKGKRKHEGSRSCEEGDDDQGMNDGENELSLEYEPNKVFKSPKSSKTVKKRRSSILNTPAIDEAVNLMRFISSKKNEKDEYSLFGEQVSIKIRKLASPYAKFTVQNIINNVLFEAEMGKYDNPTFMNPQFYAPTSPSATAAFVPSHFTTVKSEENYSRSTPSPSNSAYYETHSDVSSLGEQGGGK